MLPPAAFSIIVPVYNGGSNADRCFDSLLAARPSPGEIIIVDDGSTDGSRDQALRRGFQVVSTQLPHSGPAVARNVGASLAHGEVLLFVDSDVLVYPDVVERVALAMSDPDLAAVFGSYDDTPEDRSFLSQYKNLLHHQVHQASSTEAGSFWAGCGTIRREVFRQMGGFAQDYARPSIEDIELGYRLQRAGYRIRLVKELQVKHLKHWTWRSLIATDIFDRALPWAELIVRDRKLPSELNLRPAHRLSAVLCWLLVAALAGSILAPFLWAFVFVLVAVLVLLNLDLYRFFLAKKGLWFTVRAVPLHWFYYIYSSAAFAWVLAVNALPNPLRSRHVPARR